MEPQDDTLTGGEPGPIQEVVRAVGLEGTAFNGEAVADLTRTEQQESGGRYWCDFQFCHMLPSALRESTSSL